MAIKGLLRNRAIGGIHEFLRILREKVSLSRKSDNKEAKSSVEYDYENRIVKITKVGQTKAEFAYDALGRRIRKIDSVAGETTLYYNNPNWQAYKFTICYLRLTICGC